MRVHWHWTQRPGLLSSMRNSIDKPAGDFAVDPGVCIEARQRAGLERLRLQSGVSSCPLPPQTTERWQAGRPVSPPLS